jgi:Spy/CpxP family protein refolding chaperone
MNVESGQKARLWLALVFILGTAIGVVFGYSLAHRTLAAPLAGPPTLSEPERRAKRVAEMTKEVGLTPDQATSIDRIIHQAHDEMKAIHEKSDADVDAVRQKAREQMRQLLTVEQKPKFEAMVEKMDAERKKQQPGVRK